jgi:uncharacterized repeat protein (TIGR01451 family)
MGVSANPFRIGNLPAGDIVRTHAKPPLGGYYRNFDRKAQQLAVSPQECTNPVGTQHVIIATVCDDHGNGLRNRRVEWHVTGVGHIVEADESGFFPGRGYMVDDQYAVSYTNYKQHTLTRGNSDPSDDIHLKPGQTYLVVTSAQEGTTYVTCYAPGIYNWDKHKVIVAKHWTEVEPTFPPCATNLAGQPHVLTTRITRTRDGAPMAGYRVRYQILDGPAAVFEPGGAPVVEVLSGAQGHASATLRQLAPAPGANRIAIEVLRPSAPSAGGETVLARQEITKTWISPQLAVQKIGPAAAAVGQPILYQITVTNTGSITSRGVTIRDTVPPGMQLLGSNPPATLQGPNLVWRFSPFAPDQSVAVQFTVSALAPGAITNCAEALLDEGLAGRSCVTTQVAAAALFIQKDGPQTAFVGQPITFNITVTNRGNGPATNVVLTDSFDAGLVHQTGAAPVQQALGALAPGESRTVQIILTARVPGRLCNRVNVTADGGLSTNAEHCVVVTQPELTITKSGPKFAIVGAEVPFEIRVRNSGSIAANNVVVHDPFPPQLVPQRASHNGMIQANTVTWNLGTLLPGQEQALSVTVTAAQVGTNVRNFATVRAEGIERQSPPVSLDIRGVAALLTELIDRMDPVAVGSETTYTIQITNTGSDIASGVRLECVLPPQVEFVDAEADPSISVTRPDEKRTIRFGSFDSMEPRKRLIYQVQVRAVRPGDARFQVRVYSRELGEQPVVDEESTRIYDPQTGGMGGAETKPANKTDGSSVQSPHQQASQDSAAVSTGDTANAASDPEL